MENSERKKSQDICKVFAEPMILVNYLEIVKCLQNWENLKQIMTKKSLLSIINVINYRQNFSCWQVRKKGVDESSIVEKNHG